MLYRNATAWVALAPGTSGYGLHSQGSSANLQWSQTDLTSGVTGTLPIANGGTGTTTGSITGTGTLTFAAGGSNTHVILTPNGTGGVGIGTTSPGTMLDVAGQSVLVRGTGTTAGEIRLAPGPTTGTNYVGFKAPTTNPTSSIVWRLPAADGTSGQVLSTDGSGTLSWATDASSSGGGPAAVTGISVYTSSSTWTVPSGVTKVFVSAVGGGGGGGSASGANGGTGGSSSLQGCAITASGGTGGVGSYLGAAGTGGTASGGLLNISGLSGSLSSNLGCYCGGGAGGVSQAFTSSIPYTKSAGAGGAASNSGGGGGSGGVSVGVCTVTPGANLTVTVGAGGTAGGTWGAAGSAGIMVLQW